MRLSYIAMTSFALWFCLPAQAQLNTARRMMASLPKAGPAQRDAAASQTDLLTFYILAEVLRRSPQQAQAEDQGAGLNEIAELNDQRLQQAMDRRSKFMAALGALAQQIAKNGDTSVQNLK